MYLYSAYAAHYAYIPYKQPLDIQPRDIIVDITKEMAQLALGTETASD